MTKFSYDVLKRCVFPFVGPDAPDVILGAAFGEDVAVTRIDDKILASHVDPIISAIGNIGWLAVHVACNDIATSGVPPRWLLLLILVPHKEDEDLLKQIMEDAYRAAEDLGASILGGHTEHSAGVERPLVAVTAMGVSDRPNPVRTSGASVGDHVLVTKGIALEGTGILGHDFQDVALRLGLDEEDLARAQELVNEISVVPEALALADQGVSAMHDVTEGGVLETLLEIAHLSGVGMEIDYAKLPVYPVVSRFAEAFEFNPLRMISSGTLAATIPPERVEDASEALTDLGVPFTLVGRVVEGNGVRVVRENGTEHYTEIACEEDELVRLWSLHPREIERSDEVDQGD